MRVDRFRGASTALTAIAALLSPALLLIAGGCGDNPPPSVVRLPAGRQIAPNLRELIDQTVRTVEAAPDSAAAHGKLGMVYEANGLYVAASQSYENASQLDPEHTGWILHQAICQIALGNNSPAEALLLGLLDRSENFAPAWYWLGHLRQQEGEIDGALAAFQSALRGAPQSPPVRVAIAHCRVQQGDFQGAVSLLQPIVEQQRGYRQAHYVLGLAYKGLDNRALSMRHLRQGLDASHVALDDTTAVEVRRYKKGFTSVMENAVKSIEQGSPQQAVQLLERALQQSPGEVNLLNNLASAYTALGQHPRALEILDEAAAIEPLNFRTQINRSVVQQRQKNLPAALLSADAAVRFAPQVAEGHVERARILIALNRVPEAIPALETAVLLTPNHPWANMVLGKNHVHNQRWQEAANCFLKGLPNARNRRPMINGLARSYAELGDLPRARQFLQRLRTNWPDDNDIPALERLITQKEQGQK